MYSAQVMTAKQQEDLLGVLKARFEKHMNRHPALAWTDVQARLEANGEKLWSLAEMERTGGEPDVVGFDQETGEYIFYDCSAESPKRLTPEKNSNPKTVRWEWPRPWALSC
jgi:hypothetical protein